MRILANWKSHKSPQEVLLWLEDFQQSLLSARASLLDSGHSVIIAPAFPALTVVAEWLQQERKNLPLPVSLAVQDLSPFPKGAYTGAVSASLLQGLSVEYAVLGHSERRRFFHESSVEVANKVTQALDAAITPIVCLDDPYLEEMAVALEPAQRNQVIVAYEDLGAIGTGENKDAEHVAKVREQVVEQFGEVEYFYGGSVNASNAAEYHGIADGFLVGTASLEVKDFLALILAVARK